MPDTQTCLAAMRSRDARFDGRFCMAVRTTGIYCRPSCPALTPRVENVSFFPTAAAAQDAGYRACRRCRPDVSPHSPEWDMRSDIVARAMRLIGDGVVDREGVSGLAAHLGYSTRQVQRLIEAELGASPLALARAQRCHTARLLLETTDMAIADVAFAAGFGSVRSFNDAIGRTFALTPRQVRDRRPGHAQNPVQGWVHVRVRLSFRPPLEPGNLFGHLVATAVPGVEQWRVDEAGGQYRRTLALPQGAGIMSARPPAAGTSHVEAGLWLTDPRDLTPAIARVRRLLDLDADPVAIDEHLAHDVTLRPLVHDAPGRRVPRTTDANEFAVRTVLGQQVSTASARTHAARLVKAFGQHTDDPDGELTHLFPAPEALGDLAPEDLPGPHTRRDTVQRLARVLADGIIDLSPGCDWDAARHHLANLPGIGPWSVEMIAMRALGDPDAFPASDLGVRRALANLARSPADAAPWRPWRSYATQHLWATGEHPINTLPKTTQGPSTRSARPGIVKGERSRDGGQGGRLP